MIVMGIDQSYTSTGVIIMENDDIVFHDRICSDVNQDKFDRAQYIVDRLCHIYNKYKPTYVNIEGLSFGMSRGNVTRDLAGLQYVIICNLRKYAANINIITPKSLKKFATDNGKATKVDMYNSLPNNILNYFVATGLKKTKGLYDLVDAYWLSVYKENKK